MGSPTKEKFKEGVQQQILTNYYMSRYDKIMSRMSDRKVQTIFSERLPSQGVANQTKRKNFKELILQKKANKKVELDRHNSGKKNFKHEIEHKNNKEKFEKENKKNFYRLEETIISELYKPSPSELENGKYKEIEVLHRISYDQKREKVQPFRLVSNQEEESIQINYGTGQQQEEDYEVSVERIEHEKLSEAIRSSFDRRKSPANRTPSRSPTPRNESKKKEQKKPPKSPHYKPETKQKSEEESNSREDSYFFQNVRPSFENMERNFPKNQSSEQDGSFQKKINFMQEDRQSNASKYSKYSKYSKQKSIQRNPNRFPSRRSSLSPSVNDQKKKNPSNVDDSFHRNIPQIQHEPKISPRQQKQKQVEKNEERSQSKTSEKNRSMKSSRIHNQSELKDSLNDFSMVSRFSMISEEGMVIQEQLERELNQNQFGPYQSALTSLLALISQYPNAWPIYVVGQRILQDRHQYENRRMLQQTEMTKLQSGIQSINRTKQKCTEIQRNNLEILRLVRELARVVQQVQVQGSQ